MVKSRGTERRLSARVAAVVGAAALSLMATLSPAGPAAAASGASRCTDSGLVIQCSKNSTRIVIGLESREVHYQTPLGTAPPGGWPVAFMFQGSLFTGELNWFGAKGMPFGAYYQAKVLKTLLDNGYAVVTPEAHLAGATFWDSNNPLFAHNWTNSPDDKFMKAIFARIDSGQFGPLNGGKMFATGISSGGYMTSRMTLAYPDRFKAIAVQSASYATCLGPACIVPSLPANHAPTLLLHGKIDPIVPIWTMRLYEAKLKSAKIPFRVRTELFAGHEWLSSSPSEVVSWFNRYR